MVPDQRKTVEGIFLHEGVFITAQAPTKFADKFFL